MKIAFLLGFCLMMALLALIFLRKKPKTKKIKVELVEKERITLDLIKLTFMLPDLKQKLGLKVGEHIEIV